MASKFTISSTSSLFWDNVLRTTELQIVVEISQIFYSRIHVINAFTLQVPVFHLIYTPLWISWTSCDPQCYFHICYGIRIVCGNDPCEQVCQIFDRKKFSKKCKFDALEFAYHEKCITSNISTRLTPWLILILSLISWLNENIILIMIFSLSIQQSKFDG